MPIPPVIRRVSLYKLLRSGVTFSVEELAELHAVSAHTIVRDITALRQADDRCELIETGGVRAARLDVAAPDSLSIHR
jgi:predicted DNA-binding transcriptional regulator YafY